MENSIRIIDQKIALADLRRVAAAGFGDFVKAVVDIKKGVMAIGGEMHADGESALLADGSRQDDLWGINLHPEQKGENFVEFDSMINIRPRQGNRSRSVESQEIRAKIIALVRQLTDYENVA